MSVLSLPTRSAVRVDVRAGFEKTLAELIDP